MSPTKWRSSIARCPSSSLFSAPQFDARCDEADFACRPIRVADKTRPLFGVMVGLFFAQFLDDELAFGAHSHALRVEWDGKAVIFERHAHALSGAESWR